MVSMDSRSRISVAAKKAFLVVTLQCREFKELEQVLLTIHEDHEDLPSSPHGVS